jgi:hypothetical protein
MAGRLVLQPPVGLGPFYVTLHLRVLWPGTGEVGTTHRKDSGNAEITIVI